jgi:uncharacterized surface protein with fasciclin (FAS1) repeats
MKMKAQHLTAEHPIQIMRISLMAMIMVLISAMTFAQSTVVDVVVNSADHTTLEAAVVAAELADDLSGAGPFTLFAPTDAAFAALPEGTVASLLEDPTGTLASILLYHVVSGKALSSDLSNGQMIATLNGNEVKVKIKDGKAYIDNAQVTIADIQADNGVVHVINAVMIPSSKMADAGTSMTAQSNSGCQK